MQPAIQSFFKKDSVVLDWIAAPIARPQIIKRSGAMLNSLRRMTGYPATDTPTHVPRPRSVNDNSKVWIHRPTLRASGSPRSWGMDIIAAMGATKKSKSRNTAAARPSMPSCAMLMPTPYNCIPSCLCRGILGVSALATASSESFNRSRAAPATNVLRHGWMLCAEASDSRNNGRGTRVDRNNNVPWRSWINRGILHNCIPPHD